MKGQTIDGRLALVGFRADGVIAVDIGDSMIVLCNVVDHLKTKPLDRLVLDRFGPWMDFSDITPAEHVRDTVTAMIKASSRQIPVVAPQEIGLSDSERAASMELVDTSYTRQDFDNMLETANCADGALPQGGAGFAQDPDFMSHCIATIVPAMQQSGLHVANPQSFCSMLHLQRTGLMPTLSQAAPPAAAPVPPMPPSPGEMMNAAAPAVAPPPDLPNVAAPAQTPPAPVPLVVAATPLHHPAAPPMPAAAAPIPAAPVAPAPPFAPAVPAAPAHHQPPAADGEKKPEDKKPDEHQAPTAHHPAPGQGPGQDSGQDKSQQPATPPPAEPTPPIPPNADGAVVDKTAVSVPHPAAPPMPVTADPQTAIGKPFKRPADARAAIGKPSAGSTNNGG